MEDTSVDGPRMRRLTLTGSPSEIGRGHGAAFADEIRTYTADRVDRLPLGTSLTAEQALELADRCIPHHESFDADLTVEMTAMAAAADITPAEAVVVGGYTDLLDVVRAEGDAAVADNCTAVLVPDELAGGAGWLAQTWDMHATATPHVVMLRIEADGAPAASVFTTVGCLGQIGMNEAGLVIGINNLTAADGRLGVTWPFVVRKALRATTAADALDVIVSARLAGGHSFLVMDEAGDGFSIEAMPTAHHVERLGSELLAHTNHCLVPATRAVEGNRPAGLEESSRRRLQDATALLTERPVSRADLFRLLRDDRSICRRVEPPFDYESCGAVVMSPRRRELWACWGVPSDVEFERFEVASRV